MEEMMAAKDSILGTILDFIAQRKVAKLEKAFRNNKDLISAIQKMNASYKVIDDRLSNYCKKYPEACEEVEKSRKRLGL